MAINFNDKIEFDFSNTLRRKINLKTHENQIKEEISDLNQALTSNYQDDRASIQLPFETQFIEESQNLAKIFQKVNNLVLIGIGGSNLGTQAIFNALETQYANEFEDKNIYFADTICPHKIETILHILEEKLKEGETCAINVISKSGGTTETIAIFNIFEKLLKKYDKTYQEKIVVTTGENSKLFNYAKKCSYNVLTLPDKVGGRFSVFSNVGLFPLAFMGINVKNLLQGAKDMAQVSLNKTILKNPSAQSALSIFENSKNKNQNIINSFFFIPQLEDLGKWYRQLLGESIGKEFNLKNKKVNCGLTPSIAIGSTDLHSMAQLYLGGPNITQHTLIEIKNSPSLKLISNKDLFQIIPELEKKSLQDAMGAIIKGVKKAFEKRKIPFIDIRIKDLNAYSIGAFMQFKMCEIIFLGKLFNVNTFDQPNVEEYKLFTKEYLKK